MRKNLFWSVMVLGVTSISSVMAQHGGGHHGNRNGGGHNGQHHQHHHGNCHNNNGRSNNYNNYSTGYNMGNQGGGVMVVQQTPVFVQQTPNVVYVPASQNSTVIVLNVPIIF